MSRMQDDKPEPPLHNIEDKIMGFATHYPVSGTITNMQWNSVNLEWEYFINNDDGFDGKIKERHILPFDKAVWDYIEAKWKIYLQLLKDASEIELECRKLLRR
jgi:hypothetical protein